MVQFIALIFEIHCTFTTEYNPGTLILRHFDMVLNSHKPQDTLNIFGTLNSVPWGLAVLWKIPESIWMLSKYFDQMDSANYTVSKHEYHTHGLMYFCFLHFCHFSLMEIESSIYFEHSRPKAKFIERKEFQRFVRDLIAHSG